MAERSDPVSVFSHIFKTPLTSIKAASDLLQKHLRGLVSQKDAELLRVVIRNARTLELRIHHLLRQMERSENGVSLALDEAQLEELHALKRRKEKEEEKEEGQAVKEGKSVLVADDDPDILKLVAGALRDEGFSVKEARDGETAWDLIAKHRPSVLVLDGLMPKRDSFTLSRDAKDLDPDDYKPTVILMTAVYKKIQHKVKAKKKYGVDVYLVKPFEIEVLVNHVKGAAEGDA